MSDANPKQSRSLRELGVFSSHGDPLAGLILAVPVVILYGVVSALVAIGRWFGGPAWVIPIAAVFWTIAAALLGSLDRMVTGFQPTSELVLNGGIAALTAAAILGELRRTRTASPEDARITRLKAFASYWWIGLVPVDALAVFAQVGGVRTAFGRTALNGCLCGLIYGGVAVSIHLTKHVLSRK